MSTTHSPESETATLDISSNLESFPAEKSSNEPVNPNIVDWEGLDDPHNPMNWPKSKRIGHVVLISITCLFVNLASTMFAPGAASLMSQFHQTNETVASLTVTIYILGFAMGPLIIAPLSELYGRLPLYLVCQFLSIILSVACAVSTDIGMFLAFRFLNGCTGSAVLTIGGGTIADVIPQTSRGAAVAIYAMGPLLGPVIGPIIGGFVASSIGWRWTFYILAISNSLILISMLIFMRETYATVLLNKKAALLRKATGNLDLISRKDLQLSPLALFGHSIVRPLKILFLSPIVASLSSFTALAFSLIYLLFTTFPMVFEEQYGFGTDISGLSYLGIGIGMILGILIFSVWSDRILKKLATAGDGEMKPEYRLLLMVYFVPVMPIGFFWYGWSAWAKVHWIVPIIGTSLIGIGSLFVFMPTQIYLVDAFGEYAASALAANTIMRSIFGAFLPLAGPKVYNSLGLGWGNSLLGFLSLGFTVVPFFFYKYGEVVRKRWVVNL